MTALDDSTRCLIALAAAVATGQSERIERRAAAAVAGGVSTIWGDELVLQSVLMVGYPRALTAALGWRTATRRPAASEEDGGDFQLQAEWGRRGEATCRVVYGSNYQKLRHNVAALHPALDAWMVAEGYGRTLSRPGLDLVRREFCVVAQVMVLEAERQLHSHLRGARNAGASWVAIDEALAVAGEEATETGRAMARRLRDRM